MRLSCLLLLSLLVGCTEATSPTTARSPEVLRVAVTTSTRDTGLLEDLVPLFENQADVRVDIIAVGTGAALKLGETGDVDVVLVHAREAEDRFVESGHGIRRESVMYNSFEILGPISDPARIRDCSPKLALEKIARSESVFVSRGDESGTHKKELSLWQFADIQPGWPQYVESGQGMAATLTIADQKRGYVLCDRGTWLKFKDKIQLTPLIEASPAMHNPYGILVVKQSDARKETMELANRCVDFFISPETQRRIRDFQVEGEPLFVPLRLNTSDQTVIPDAS